ncbi:MAG: putative quinol monooxygenase [Hyphomonadaceae bacterium]
MILITGTVVIADADRAGFIAASTHHVALSRTEPGCISHAVHEDVMAPGTFVFVERWRDMDAVKEHFAKDYSRETAAMLRKLAVSSSGVEIHEVASTRVI